MKFQHPVLMLAAYLVCIWTIPMLAVAAIGGWIELGRVYRAAQPFAGSPWRFQSAQFRFWIGYNNILTMGSDAAGLYLAMPFLFRLGHPPLFIPWLDISVRPGKFLWRRVYIFEFRQTPSIHVRFSEKLGMQIQAAAGPSWPGLASQDGPGGSDSTF